MMFVITPVQDVELAKQYCSACNTYLREGAFIYAMKDHQTGALMGISQFEICGDHGYVYDLCHVPGLDDFEAMFILGRQTMNFIDSCGAHECRIPLTHNDSSLIKAIGFTVQGEYYSCDMRGMFDGSRCGGH